MARGVLFDIEGTLVGDKRYLPTPGAVELVAELRAAGVPTGLITNNSTSPPEVILDKLRAAGFVVDADKLVTCTTAAVGALAERRAERCFVIGTNELRGLFAGYGLTICDNAEVDAVIVGLDTALTYAALRTACEAIVGHGALLLALHLNRLYKDDEGRVAPSVGAIATAIAYATACEPICIGKPSPDFYAEALATLKLPPEEVVVISDDPFSDLAGAKRLGLDTVFVLVGKYGDPEVVQRLPAGERPDRVVGDLTEIDLGSI